MILFSEIESAVMALESAEASPADCLAYLKSVERGIVAEGSDTPNLLPTIRKMKWHCVGLVMANRKAMLNWLEGNYDRVVKRKMADQKDAATGQSKLF